MGVRERLPEFSQVFFCSAASACVRIACILLLNIPASALDFTAAVLLPGAAPASVRIFGSNAWIFWHSGVCSGIFVQHHTSVCVESLWRLSGRVGSQMPFMFCWMRFQF